MNKVEDFSNIIIKNKDNKYIIDEFIRYYYFIYTTYTESPKTSKENYYKLLIIKKIIDLLCKFKTKILSGIELKSIKGIGIKTITRIDEIIKTGKLSEIKEKKEQYDSVTELASIYGIGPSKASYFYEKFNIKNIKELLENKEIKLTNQMKLGIKYKDVLVDKIPRILIARLEIFIQKEIYTIDKDILSIICGSYRRNKDYSSDIDILITSKKLTDIKKSGNILKIILDKLEQNLIIDKLTESYNTHFQGFGTFKNIPDLPKDYDHSIFNTNINVIRIDIIVIPLQSFYTAMMHFTGPGDFNIKLRKHAKLLNMKLNEYGLFKVNNNKQIIINSEVDIFSNLLLKYLPPENR